MKHNIVWVLFLVGILLASLTAFAEDNRGRDDRSCSLNMIAGSWGLIESGTLILRDLNGNILATGPMATAGRYTIDAHGNLSGAWTASEAGKTTPANLTGTATVNPDCTGTITLSLWDPSNPETSLGGGTSFVVYVDNARKALMVITSPPIPYPPPNGGFGMLGMTLTAEATKLFPGGDEDQ